METLWTVIVSMIIWRGLAPKAARHLLNIKSKTLTNLFTPIGCSEKKMNLNLEEVRLIAKILTIELILFAQTERK
jgi:hypothetical protein